MPKLFTDSGGEELEENKSFKLRAPVARFTSFLDRTVAALRAEMLTESAIGMIPGDRGKVGGNWCRPPLTQARALVRGIYHQFLWPESYPVSPNTN